ncbi:hypothetical protein [Corynebacterium ciconiae]|uniref:hypothetical protein n=1 Tax=Corynebacterium ciconiae TaxID=227319 RepID=UPI000371F126|nr:hypothetical protein [Corynebacterium ciconiae]
MSIPAPACLDDLRADGYFHQACLDAATLPVLSSVTAVEAGDAEGHTVRVRLSTDGQKPTEITGQRISRILSNGVWQWLHPRVAEAAAEFSIPEFEHEWVAPRPADMDVATAQQLRATSEHSDSTSDNPPQLRAYRSLATAAELASAVRTVFSDQPVLYLPTADNATILVAVPAAGAADFNRTLLHAGAFMPASPNMDRSIEGLARLFECEYRPCGDGRYELRLAGQIVPITTREGLVIDYGLGMSLAEVLRDARDVPNDVPPFTHPAVASHPAIIQMAHTNGIPVLMRAESAHSPELNAELQAARRCVLYRSGALPPAQGQGPAGPAGVGPTGAGPSAAGNPLGDGGGQSPTTPVSQPPSH